MNKWKVRFLAFMMAIVLAFTTVPSASATEATTYISSNMTEEKIEIAFQGSNIIFKDFPDREDFNYVMLSLYGADNKTYLQGTYSTASDITMSTSGITDGTYWIQIYKAPEQYTTYWSYMYQKKGLQIVVQNGMVTCVASPVFEHNKSLYESNLSSKAALEYYLQPSYGVESEDKAIIKLAKSIVDDTDTDYEKVRKVHDWVANNVWYNWDGLLNGSYGDNSATGVLESKISVCQGYANLSAALLRALGIPTKVVTGYALGATGGNQWTDSLVAGTETNHAWNEAYADGRWVIFDATWDSSNKYENGTFSTGTGLDGYKYFDPTIESFSYDHKIIDGDEYKAELGRELDRLAMESVKKNLVSQITLKKGTKSKKLVPKFASYEGESLKKRVTLTFEVSNPSIVKVNKKGKITAKKAGTTSITVRATTKTSSLRWSVRVTIN